MTDAMLKIAVVGHTNTGKTSLLRTLTRRSDFGEVADSPGTTRHVEGARLSLDGKPALEWFDTPGMEDSIALLEYLERLDDPDTRRDGPARIRRFLDSPEAHRRYEQEARVLTKMLDCDAALYVIDARDPVLSKHRDELALLAACGRPLLPVLNFVNAPHHRADEWRDAMARLGLHAALEFDTIAPPLDGEHQLYAKLAVLLDRHAQTLHRLADVLMREREERRQAAWQLAADLLIDVAALRVTSPADEEALKSQAEALRARVRRREQACVDALLALYNFHRNDYADNDLPLVDMRWGMDLFHPQAIKDMGIRLGTGMAAGAMAGAAVDMLSAGLSLGTGMLIGAAAGGLWQGVERLGGRLLGKLRGYREITVDDAILRLLALRQRQLIEALDRRGHAAREPVRLDTPADDAWRSARLPKALKEARSRPEWSALNKGHEDDERRKQVVVELARVLARDERDPSPAA
ncbi:MULTISPECIES: GTPase/DUF3482 domain-containing protein [unclassified Bordetella]|uniref:GTPase/DUF3482 domain-containing protein n=1 Tax=unclassified Bordetella TaxID=2630031 RepID=UPI001321A519|nr:MULTISPECIES: GTPase/DUF3482 domain-containing protein [unclassified Bordetella]MVW73443.1 DUF3482 domain-containing protein [Bordetella sp. 15P40C-2]MVW78405.1 DUF3482 domain-containing protein [Bordetella sp. 02P26C-1]